MSAHFRFVWDSSRSPCEDRSQHHVAEALQLIDYDAATGGSSSSGDDYDDDGIYDHGREDAPEVLAETVGSCPMGCLSEAAEHLRRAGDNNHALRDAVQPALDALDAHQRSRCSCGDDAWSSFVIDADFALYDLPEGVWMVDDHTHRASVSTLYDTPECNDLTDGDIRAGERPDRLEISYDGGPLVVTVQEPGSRRVEYHYVLLADVDGALTRVVEPGEVPEGSSPAHLVMTYEPDVRRAASALLCGDADRSLRWSLSGSGAVGARDLLGHLTRRKHQWSPSAWSTLVRLSSGWSGTVEELETAAHAVLVPAHTAALV